MSRLALGGQGSITAQLFTGHEALPEGGGETVTDAIEEARSEEWQERPQKGDQTGRQKGDEDAPCASLGWRAAFASH